MATTSFRRSSFRCKNNRVSEESYPDVLDPALVGTSSRLAKAGGGYIWDEVLEYHHPIAAVESRSVSAQED